MARLISFFQDLFIRKLGPPVIGAFVAAWAVLHWDYLALLFWGNGLLEDRIATFKLAVGQNWFKNYTAPFLIALAYLFGLPYLSYCANWLQMHAKKITHKLRVEAESSLFKQERELNIARALADPNKSFIEALARQKVEKERLALEKQQAEAEKLQAEAKKQLADSEIAENQAIKEQAMKAENELKLERTNSERLRLEAATQIQKATVASNRFPAVYVLMQFLDAELQADGVTLSFEQITSIIAILFGYLSFENLVNDPKFNNETVNKLLGMFYDVEELSKQIYQALADDEEIFERFEPSYLYNCFDNHPHLRLLSQEVLDDLAMSYAEDSQYELFNHDSVTSAMAETNTIFDEVIDIEFINSGFDKRGYKSSFSITIAGHERREDSVRGLTPINITATVRAPLIVGQKGLGQLELEVTNAEVVWPR